ncbi:hypothetical protein [Rhodohalobacter sp. 8-1]|uniref:hypothetical protein n=1 Tax=Rhodohalobacter sp. 8-1 TaxID=3131972 RepID=UPI0030EBF7B9
MAPVSQVEQDVKTDPEYQYSDSSIAEAFQTMPQIKPPIKISIYNAGQTVSHIAGDLDALTGVRNTTYITPGLIDFVKPAGSPSERRNLYGYRRTIRSMDLRALAAQSHSDVILYIEPFHEVRTGANALAVTYAGILPMFFVPGNSVEVTSTVDVYLIDVRNGFIYSSYRNQTRAEKRFVKIGHRKHTDELIERNNSVLLQSVVGELERVLKNESYFVSTE